MNKSYKFLYILIALVIVLTGCQKKENVKEFKSSDNNVVARVKQEGPVLKIKYINKSDKYYDYGSNLITDYDYGIQLVRIEGDKLYSYDKIKHEEKDPNKTYAIEANSEAEEEINLEEYFGKLQPGKYNLKKYLVSFKQTQGEIEVDSIPVIDIEFNIEK